jgi:orotate phosphoribosyltransferase
LSSAAGGETAGLASRIRDCARVTGHFVLRSGATSDTYFDKYQFEADPALLRDIARAMVPVLPPDTQVLAGLELGGIPLVTALSAATGIPAAFLRKQAKTYGTCRYAEGAALAGKRFILVEDVVSSGGAIVDFLTMLKADGLVPDAALCVIDRGTGGVARVAEHGVRLISLYSMQEIEDAR